MLYDGRAVLLCHSLYTATSAGNTCWAHTRLQLLRNSPALYFRPMRVRECLCRWLVIHQQMHPGGCCVLLARLEMLVLNSLRGCAMCGVSLHALVRGGARCNAFGLQVWVFSG